MLKIFDPESTTTEWDYAVRGNKVIRSGDKGVAYRGTKASPALSWLNRLQRIRKRKGKRPLRVVNWAQVGRWT